MTYLGTKEDLAWLEEVHGIPYATAFSGAILFGNEDAPSRVELYARDDYRCTPQVWVTNPQDTEQRLCKTEEGEPCPTLTTELGHLTREENGRP